MTGATSHPDLARLMAVADGMDAQCADVDTDNPEEVSATVEAMLAPLADSEAMEAMVTQRADSLLAAVPELVLLHPRAILRSVWMDGFTLGVLYQQRGGHVD